MSNDDVSNPMLALIADLAMVPAACGGSGDAEGDVTTTGALGEELEETLENETTDDLGDSHTVEDDVQELADEMADDLEDLQEAEGGGFATLAVGEETWEFESVLCAFGPEEIGQEGAEFVLSALEDGLQLHVSIDSFGHSVSLDDIDGTEGTLTATCP